MTIKRIAALFASAALIVAGAYVVKPTTAVETSGTSAGQGSTDGFEWTSQGSTDGFEWN
jgi:hypothetical protein